MNNILVKICFVLATFLSVCFSSGAQENVTTFGIQFKPIFSNKFFDTGPVTVQKDYLQVDFKPKGGYSFGMVIRKGLTDRISLESGINYTKRVYNTTFLDLDSLVTADLAYRFISYEVPIQALFFVRLGDQFWMNGAGGVCIDLYASDVIAYEFVNQNSFKYDFEVRTFRRSIAQASILANYGFEYRTKEDGYIYLGLTYHRPFNSMAISEATYLRDNFPTKITTPLSGNYLTVDLRYYFQEEPQKKKKKQKNNN